MDAYFMDAVHIKNVVYLFVVYAVLNCGLLLCAGVSI